MARLCRHFEMINETVFRNRNFECKHSRNCQNEDSRVDFVLDVYCLEMPTAAILLICLSFISNIGHKQN